MKPVIYKQKYCAEISLKNCPLLHMILLLQKAREPYVKRFIQKTLEDEARKIDRMYTNV